MAVLRLLGAAVGFAIALAVSADTETWGGHLNIGKYADNVPVNVTVDGNTATVSFVYDVDARGQRCARDIVTNLKWSDDGTTVEAQGNQKDPSYYTFIGKYTSATVVTGTITPPSSASAEEISRFDGSTFTWTKNTVAEPSTCNPNGPVSTNPNIWPLPAFYSRGNTTVQLSAAGSGFFTLKGLESKFLDDAFDRYVPTTFPHATGSSSFAEKDGVTGLDVTVDSAAEDYPQITDNESYVLTVPTSGQATLQAPTIWGALRGLETFSQLVTFDFDTESYIIADGPWRIVDQPRFPHRGLMIDTARHFEPLATIRKMIDSLVYAKLNVLHWHMVDSQSYPFEVKGYPKLWDAAWSPAERYQQDDVRAIVDYAKARGVRVMVEFDVPGHADSWCKGYPEICPSTSCTSPLNVANNKTFDVITQILKECTGGQKSTPGNPSPGIFKDNFVHLGGDEVNTACWSKTAAVSEWLTERNMTPDDGYAYFVKRVADIAIAQGHRPVQWSEVFDHFKGNLTKETIVHIWKSVTNVTEVVALGYNVLVNVGYDRLSWYLDNLNVMWDAVYQNEPCAGVPDDLCPLVLGGHGEMWGETVDSSDIQQTVWPRLAAIAERLWSPRQLTQSVTDAHPRIQSFRCLLNRRGIAAAPVNNQEARSSPGGPGGCLTQ